MFETKIKSCAARLFTAFLLILISYTARAAVECDFNVTQSWGSGGNAQIAITNTGSTAITLDPIIAEFPAGVIVGSSWHMALSGSNPYTFTPYAWNSSVAAGQTVYAGMSLGGNVSSGTEVILGGACGGGSEANRVPIAALSCTEATMVGDPPIAGGPSIETYFIHCINGSTDPDGDTLDAVFDWGDGTVNTETSHKYTESGVYSIYLTVSDGEYSDVALTQVTATGNTLPPTAALDCSVSANKTVTCDGSQSSDPDGDPLGFIFQWGDGEFSTGSNTATHTYAENGTYEISLNVTDGHNSASESATVIVDDTSEPPLEAEFSYTVEGLRVSVDVPYDVTAGITHTWNWGDGSAESTGFPQSHTYAQAGTYTVTLTLRDEAGRTGSASQEVTVTDDSEPETGASCTLSANNFSTGFVYNITLMTQGESVLSDWDVCVLLDDESTVTNSFNSTALPPIGDGNWVCFGPRSWNYNLSPGNATTFGFMGSGPGVILDVTGACDSLQ